MDNKEDAVVQDELEDERVPVPNKAGQATAQQHMKLEDLKGKVNSSYFTPAKSNEKLALYRAQTAVYAAEQGTDLPPKDAENRKCTDVLFLILFLMYWLGTVGVSIFAFAEGDPRLLVYGTDNQGRVCGTGNLTDQKELVWPRFSVDIFETVAANSDDLSNAEINLFGVCVSSCPEVGDYVCSVEAEEAITDLITLDGNLDRNELIEECVNSASLADFFDIDLDLGLSSCKSSVIRDECFETLFNHSSLLHRCFPDYTYEVELVEAESGCTKSQNASNFLGQVREQCVRFKTVTKVTQEEPTESDVLFSTYNSAGRKIQQYFSDLYETADVVFLMGLLVPLVLSIVYISLMWFIANVVVWATVLGSVAASVAFTTFLYFKAGVLSQDLVDDIVGDAVELATNNEFLNVSTDLTDSVANVTEDALPESLTQSEEYAQEFLNAAYVCTALTVLLFIVILFLIPKIVKAIQFFKEAAKTLRRSLSLLFVPILSGVVVLLNALFFFFSSAYIFSIGDIQFSDLNISLPFELTDNTTSFNDTLTSTEFVSVSYRDVVAVYVFFGFLWTAALISAIRTMTISGAIADLYYKDKYEEDDDGLQLSDVVAWGFGRLKTSLYITLRFHLGTGAFGALLIAIVQLLRYVAVFIDQRTKNLQQENRLVKILMLSVHCFLRCVEKCLEYVSKNSYILTAMHGDGFCTSSRKAFYLIASNLAQVSTVNFMSEILTKFGQIFVTISSVVMAFLWLDYDPKYDVGGDSELTSIIFPLVAVFLFAWVVSAEIMGIYDVAIDTILISYCYDKSYGVKDYNAEDNKFTRSSGVKQFIADNEKPAGQLANQKAVYSF